MSTTKKSTGKSAKKVAKKSPKAAAKPGVKKGAKAPARVTVKAAAKPGVKKGAKAPARVAVKAAAKPGVKKGAKAPARVAAKAAAKKAPKRAAATAAGMGAARSTADFMAHAYAMEVEAAERYAEFADAMEVHNNREVGELFRKLSRIEQRHADQIMEQMGWKQSPSAAINVRWAGTEGPETADPTELHYLMQPYHALQIALLNEKRARDFFKNLAKVTKDAGVRAGALEMEEEEEEHVRLIEEWLKRTPKPAANWQSDMDPPVLSD